MAKQTSPLKIEADEDLKEEVHYTDDSPDDSPDEVLEPIVLSKTAQSIVGKFWTKCTNIPGFGTVKGIVTPEAAAAFCSKVSKDETIKKFVSESDVHTAWNKKHQHKSNPNR